MSVPDFTANVKRAQRVTLSWQDEYGHQRRAEFEGLDAICVQHEVDHLSGLLFLDRVACLNSDVYRRKRYL